MLGHDALYFACGGASAPFENLTKAMEHKVRDKKDYKSRKLQHIGGKKQKRRNKVQSGKTGTKGRKQERKEGQRRKKEPNKRKRNKKKDKGFFWTRAVRVVTTVTVRTC